ncbi:hypothetical protein CRV08_08710 [Halarcobacter ebronensis]|uniref:Prepilin-type cleavage/methylation domain-containing protein n=1 Tax=Halarcobacter ebronensis TaxID=1462615 RepID=A0A4Q0YD25_9BACT|nr:prepilin-type N-terminal cleavage/methylation domain-containing protein [Halarcobacter ebronensis]RXJ68322.1 hypothetical protein CRV08_08710 [Halarcobacter ebronensis]
MKNSFTLIEVLISIVIVTIVIGSLLKVKDQNIYFLQSSDEKTLNQNYISLFALNYGIAKNRNEKKQIGDELLMQEDYLKKTNENITIKDDVYNATLNDEKIFDYKIFKTNYSLQNKFNNSIYVIKFDE